ncbi:hypothetical protein IAK88_004104 [Salmonella enterica]|nr:hypothetical protein [Salmonella enterica]
MRNTKMNYFSGDNERTDKYIRISRQEAEKNFVLYFHRKNDDTGAKGITVMIRCCFMYYPPCSGLKLQEDSTAVSLPARCVRQGY